MKDIRSCDCDGVTATCMHCDPKGEKWAQIQGWMRPYHVAHVSHLADNYGSTTVAVKRELIMPELDEDSYLDLQRGF